LKPRPMISPSCTSTAPTGTSPSGALGGQGQGFAHEVLIAAAVDDRRDESDASRHLDGGHQAGFHVVDHMAMEHPHPGLSATSATRARSFLPSR
jgi:hypothetical protein